MPQTFVLPKQVILNNGAVAANAVAYFYKTGTTTPQAVYMDAALTTAVTSLTASSAGVFSKVYLNPNAQFDYRIRIETAQDALIYQEDDISRFAVSQVEIGAALYPQSAAEAAAAVTPTSLFYDYDDPQRYGADPTFTNDSTSAIQTALDLSSPAVEFTTLANRTCKLRAGRYKITAPLVMSYEMTLEGEGEYNTVIEAENNSGAFPLFINDVDDPQDSCTRVRVRDITLRYGEFAFELTIDVAEVASLIEWENVRFDRQTVRAIECTGLFICNNFKNCIFFYCGGAIRTALQANLNNFMWCRFEGLSDNVIQFLAEPATRGGEINTFLGCRFEARETPATDTGKVVITLENCINTEFHGCYFEDTFTTILSETDASQWDSTRFINCKFSGEEVAVSPPGAKSEIFLSDGIVVFEECYFEAGSSSASTATFDIRGRNRGLNSNDAKILSRHDAGGRGMTAPFTPNSGTATPVFRFSRTTVTAGATNYAMIGGKMTVYAVGVDSGGNPFAITKVFPFSCTAFSNASMDLDFGTELTGENNGPAAVVAAGKVNDAAGLVEATVTVTEASYLQLRVRAEIDYGVVFGTETTIPTVAVLDT